LATTGIKSGPPAGKNRIEPGGRKGTIVQLQKTVEMRALGKTGK